MTERVFMIIAGLFLLTALVLLWRNNLSAAFVIGTLGIVAWFLGYRAQLRAKRRSEPTVETEEDVKD
ncbi:MAG TPA: hypothetical protein VGQ72_04415 [Pyrinomonadaceae bacterium]|jgi:Flp pilus assembly protein TadB|nr:hypothetical protein [Pyrinomonadaceae bacterium]